MYFLHDNRTDHSLCDIDIYLGVMHMLEAVVTAYYEDPTRPGAEERLMEAMKIYCDTKMPPGVITYLRNQKQRRCRR